MRQFALLLTSVLALLVGGFVPAAAAANGVSEAVKVCKTQFAAYGFGNHGACVSHVARGGTLATVAPQLSLALDPGPCGTSTSASCAVSLRGEGLAPGSTVVVGSPEVTYGATVVVDSAGRVTADRIFQMGSCVTAAYVIQDFIARGTAGDGSPVESSVLTVDFSAIMPVC